MLVHKNHSEEYSEYSYGSYGKQQGLSCLFLFEGTQEQLEDGIEAARQILMPLYTSMPRAGATRCNKMKGSMGGNVLNVEFEPCQNCRPKR